MNYNILILNAVTYLLGIIAYTLIFRKAGKKAFLGIIPFYREWVMLDVIKLNKKLFLLYLPCSLYSLTSSILNTFWGINLTQTYPILMILVTAGLVYSIITATALGNAFSKGGAFKVGLVLIAPICELILGSDRSKYKYREKKNKKAKKKS